MSFTIEMKTTNPRGSANVGTPLVSEIPGINYMINKHRKYKFDILLNYNMRFKGKKVIRLYFDVET